MPIRTLILMTTVLLLPVAAAAAAAEEVPEPSPAESPGTPETAPPPTAPVEGAEPGETAEGTEAPPDDDADDQGPTSATEAWWEKLKQGGKTMWALGFLSVTGLTFALERLFRLRRGRIVPQGLADQANRLWQAGQIDQLEALCSKQPSTLGRIIRFIVRHRGNPVSDVSSTAGDLAAVELRSHLRRAYPLAVVGTLSPLLGLMGTVFGMIECFDVINITGELSDPSQLAGGISKALITTATGLVIAVPALGFYHYFKDRTNLYGDMLEQEVTDLMTSWLMKKEEA